jgi:flagellar biosynthetic protein FlhB
MAGDDQEKTEEATQTRRDEYRKRGQVAQTKELASCLFLLASVGAIYGLGRFFLLELSEIFHYAFGADMVQLVRSGEILEAGKVAGAKMFMLIAPVLAISLLISLASTVLQVGFLQVEDAFSPDLNKINPLNGFKRLFSLKQVAELVKAFLKFLFIGGILYLVMKTEVLKIPMALQWNVSQTISYLGGTTARILGSIGIAMAVLAAADYFFQRWELEKEMRMSKQEIKEEAKSREGDPLIKSRIRKVQREMANRRMMEKVPKADVIITNPTHIAVALKYSENLPAPQLIAKGGDLIAEKIKEIAKENNIPIIENKPLARTIFKTMKIGQVIPKELFVAVAEVLAYVYKLRRKVRRR